MINVKPIGIHSNGLKSGHVMLNEPDSSGWCESLSPLLAGGRAGYSNGENFTPSFHILNLIPKDNLSEL